MGFLDFVAIRLNHVNDQTIDHKSISSFLNSVRGHEGMALEDKLKLWIVNMIDRGLTLTSRKRYVEKLSSLYKEYSRDNNLTDNPFEGVRELCAYNVPGTVESLKFGLAKIENIFDAIMTDAKSKPELAVFLYLLFHASSDIQRAIYLTTEEYKPEFRQLDEIIKPADFHHRRKYVFDLNQSRKRTPQLVREVNHAIDTYFKVKDIKISQVISHKTVVALWMVKARKCGVSFADLKRMFPEIPEEYGYLHCIKGANLTDEDINSIKHHVAESFAPSGKRWYAIKLRRGTVYDLFVKNIRANLAQYYDDNLIFYPQQEIRRRVEKKIVTTTIPVIPDIAFFYISPRHIGKVDAFIKSERMGYVFRVSNSLGSSYSVIDKGSMSCFQRMIGLLTPDIKVGLTDESPVGVGRKVLITGGIMEGYEGTIYDIKDTSGMRLIYIRLSDKYSIKAEVQVEEFFVKAIV